MKPLCFILSLILLGLLLTVSLSPPGDVQAKPVTITSNGVLHTNYDMPVTCSAQEMPALTQSRTNVLINNENESVFNLSDENISLPEGKQLKHPFEVAGILTKAKDVKITKAKHLIPYGKRY